MNGGNFMLSMLVDLTLYWMILRSLPNVLKQTAVGGERDSITP